MSGIKAVFFDVDGTMYPKRKMQLNLVRVFLRHPVYTLVYSRAREKIRTPELAARREEIHDKEGFRKLEAELMGKSPEKVDEKVYDSIKRINRNLKPFKHLREAIVYAKEKGLKLYVLSDFPVENKVKTLGVQDLMDGVYSSEDFGRLKPDPASFLAVASIAGVRPEEVLYVGDSRSKDIAGAAAAGMKSCYISPNHPNPNNADYMIQSWYEFEKLIDEVTDAS